ncbi:MAG: hypothetical protein CMJ70_10675 [Planctomycetaceae bacterium]|nr:hypothetical protein [Planctomycetaceae bacterium]
MPLNNRSWPPTQSVRRAIFLFVYCLGASLPAADAPPPAVVPHQRLPGGGIDHSAQTIDRYFTELWQQQKLTPIETIGDAAFLRRVSLTLNGTPATAAEVRAFLADSSPNKRQTKVNQLLSRSHYADYWGFRLRDWITALREVKGQGTNLTTLYQYGRQAMAENRSWGRIATDLIATQGNIAIDGRANFGVYFDGEPNEYADAITRLFLGRNLACAQCHDHPYITDWKQEHYWGLAAFFARTESWDINVIGKDKFDERFPDVGRSETSISSLPGGDAAIDGGGGENRAVADVDKGEVRLPNADGTEDITPAPLGGSPIQNVDTLKRNRREQFATWVSHKENPWFATTAVNRFWLELTGRGFVATPDGFSPDEEVLHASLLTRLANDFTKQGYDIKWLIRSIVLSQVFQVPHGDDPAADTWWHRAPRRKLNADQWFAAVLRATGEEKRIYQLGEQAAPLLIEERNGRIHSRVRLLREGAEKIRQGPFAYLADRLPPAEELALLAADVENKHREALTKVRREYADAGAWLKQMRAPARRAMSPASEALWRMNGPFVSQCLSRGLTVPHIATLPDADRRLDTIYLSTLGRLPAGSERKRFSSSPVSTEPAQIASFFWAFLQSTEFQTY